MKEYERLTDKNRDWFEFTEINDIEIYRRLQELENKIEDGTLIDKAKLSIESVDKNKLKMKKDDIIWAWQFDNGCCEYRIEELTAQIQNLENKINNGTLIELPCKVGDTVYWVFELEKNNLEILEGKIRGLSISQNNTSWFSVIYEYGLTFEHTFKDCWNKTVFLTKAEAEKKLKELQSG